MRKCGRRIERQELRARKEESQIEELRDESNEPGDKKIQMLLSYGR
jgi:hypothetical protein